MTEEVKSDGSQLLSPPPPECSLLVPTSSRVLLAPSQTWLQTWPLRGCAEAPGDFLAGSHELPGVAVLGVPGLTWGLALPLPHWGHAGPSPWGHSPGLGTRPPARAGWGWMTVPQGVLWPPDNAGALLAAAGHQAASRPCPAAQQPGSSRCVPAVSALDLPPAQGLRSPRQLPAFWGTTGPSPVQPGGWPARRLPPA